MLNLLVMSDGMTGLVGFLLGLAIVFLGIAVLVFIVWLAGKILAVSTAKKSEQAKAAAETVKIAAPAEVNDGEIPEHVKVAITAAVYAYYAQADEKCEFTVRKIVRR